MKNLATAFFLLAFTTGALAQQPPTEVTIKLTQEKLNVLSQALEAMPYKIAAPLIGDIMRQIQAQQAPAPEKPSVPSEAR